MFLTSSTISRESYIKDIVLNDYRTAAVFEKYGISYCCGAKWNLGMVCEMQGINPGQLVEELHKVIRPRPMACNLPYHEWKIDFLTEYIVHIHHHYLRQTLPELEPRLDHFVEEHERKDARLAQVKTEFYQLRDDLLPHLREEEEVVFPYIRHVSHAYESKDSYAGLLVKTLRKPIQEMMGNEHQRVQRSLSRFRELTDNYTPPANACTSHRVIFQKLQELDHDLAQHLYLENEVLFPRALAIEFELLQNG